MTKILNQTTQHQNSIDPEPTLRDVIAAINGSSTAVAVELHEIKEDIVGIKQDITGIKGEIVGIKQDISGIKATMVTKEELKQELVKVVTKEYLDDKLSDLKGDLVNLVRKEDHKVDTVVTILHDHQVLSGQDLQQIDQVGLFPKTITP